MQLIGKSKEIHFIVGITNNISYIIQYPLCSTVRCLGFGLIKKSMRYDRFCLVSGLLHWQKRYEIENPQPDWSWHREGLFTPNRYSSQISSKVSSSRGLRSPKNRLTRHRQLQPRKAISSVISWAFLICLQCSCSSHKYLMHNLNDEVRRNFNQF